MTEEELVNIEAWMNDPEIIVTPSRLPECWKGHIRKLITAAREANRLRKLFDDRPVSFLEHLESRVKELVPDYPYAKNDAFEWLWALSSAYEGTCLANDDCHKEIARLKTELAKWRPLTPEEAQKAYDEAEAVPLSEERIDEIIKAALDPATTLPNDDKAKLVGHVRRLRTRVEVLEGALEGILSEQSVSFAREAHVRKLLNQGEPK